MSIIKQDYGSLGNDVQTQMLIAPVLAEMVATQAFAIGDQFIVDNVLYKATKAIAIGDAISVGTGTTNNCVLSDSITQQINKDHYNDLGSAVDISTYTALTNVYTFPSDGYAYIRSGVSNGDYATLIILGSTSTNVFMYLDARHHQGDTNYNYGSLYVKKGMKVYTLGIQGTSSLALFIPLTA